MTEHLAIKWVRRYKIFFLIGLIILSIQVFLAYKSFGLQDENTPKQSSYEEAINLENAQLVEHEKRDSLTPQKSKSQWGFESSCEIVSKEALSALQRAKSLECRMQISNIACDIQNHNFYPSRMESLCPAFNFTSHKSLGCYRDEKELRLLSSYFVNLKSLNNPNKCIAMCLQSGYPYAGVQYGKECFCGVEAPPNSAKLADSSCNMPCSGDAAEVCGGYYTMNVYETGIAKFHPRIANTSGVISSFMNKRVRIVFLLTLNGRALRQVHRLIKALYASDMYFYIHVDARQQYLYRKLLELEPNFPNIRIARKRFSTIWGGASLLTMLLQCMEDLLETPWKWDFVINLSESDYPVKTVDKLVEFLSANRESNFVKSHGREPQRFIQKQGLDKTFVECDTHMWRIGDRTLPEGIQIDGGSDWVALSRPFVQFVVNARSNQESHLVNDKELNLLQGLLKIFRQTLLPAESFFHTVLRNTRFCPTYVDNNLHVTNWKRKLGCKCQYKHVVDWCGCSPNDFKPEDWNRLQLTEHKQLYFARKFEPIINQAILLKLEEWLYGPYPSEYANLNSYWQSFYDAVDDMSKTDDLTRTVGESLMRIAGRELQVQPGRLIELNHYKYQDEYKGFLMRYEASYVTNSQKRSFQLESRVRPLRVKVTKNSKFGKRLKNIEVSSEFDQKEQIARNFAKILGPYSEPVLSFSLTANSGATSASTSSPGGAHSYNLTLLWLDPTGRLQDFNELHIEDSTSNSINFSKSLLQTPLTPGIWTLKLIGRIGIYAQTNFLITPLALHQGQSLTKEKAENVNGGSHDSLPEDFEIPLDWQQYLPSAQEIEQQQKFVIENSQRTGKELHNWVDDLVSKFFHLRETCVVQQNTNIVISSEAVSELPLCRNTAWSSLTPDPKSDMDQLIKNV